MHTNAQDNKTIQDMADAMRRYGDGCTREDLNLHFTSDEITRFEAKARARANDDSVRQINRRAA